MDRLNAELTIIDKYNELGVGTHQITVGATATGYTRIKQSQPVDFNIYSVTFNITNGTAFNGQIAQGETRTFILASDGGYFLPSSISVTNADYTYNRTLNDTFGEITLSNPTGNVTISITCETRTFTISTSVTNGSYSGASSIVSNDTAIVTISANSGYDLPSDVSVSGASYWYDSANGNIHLSMPTGSVTISAVCTQQVAELVTLTVYGIANLADSSTVPLQLYLGKNGYCVFNVADMDANASNCSYNSGTGAISMDLNFTYNGLTLTGMSGNVSIEQGEVSNVTFTGTFAPYIANNGNITLSQSYATIDFEGWDTTTVQQVIARSYRNMGVWETDTSADRIVMISNENFSIQKFNCIQIKGYSNVYRITFASDLGGFNVTHASFWVKNDTGSANTINAFVYQTSGLGSELQVVSNLTIPADGEWHFVNVAFNTVNIQNFGITFSSSSTGMYVDYMSLA